MNMTEALQRAYFEYLSQRSRVSLPERESSGDKETVWASSLGYCPLKNALERKEVPQKYPLAWRERASELHLMEQGTRDALPLQEALVWKFGMIGSAFQYEMACEYERTGFYPEMPLVSEELNVRGKADGVLVIDGVPSIIEIKRRDTPQNQNTPQPRLGDCLQLMAYGAILQVNSLYLITVDRYTINVWHLRPQSGGFVVVNDETGERWDNPANTPETLNLETVKAEIARQAAYLTGGETADPMPNFLNEEAGWMCYKWEGGNKPLKYKRPLEGRTERTERIKRRCPHFCHSCSPNATVREVEAGSKKYEIVGEPDA